MDKFIKFEEKYSDKKFEPRVVKNDPKLAQSVRTFIIENDSIETNNATTYLRNLSTDILDEILELMININRGIESDNTNKAFGRIIYAIFQIDGTRSNDLFSFINVNDINEYNELSEGDKENIELLIKFFRLFFTINFREDDGNITIQYSNVNYFYAYLRSIGQDDPNIFQRLIQVDKKNDRIYVTEYLTDYIQLLRQSLLITGDQFKLIMNILKQLNFFLNSLLNGANNLYVYSRQLKYITSKKIEFNQNVIKSNIENFNDITQGANVRTDIFQIPPAIPQIGINGGTVIIAANNILDEEEIIDADMLETIQTASYQEDVTEEDINEQIKEKLNPFLLDSVFSYCLSYVKGGSAGADYIESISTFITFYLPHLPSISWNPIPYLTDPLPILVATSGGGSQLAIPNTARYTAISLQTIGFVASVVISYYSYDAIYNFNEESDKKVREVIDIMDNQIIPQFKLFGEYSPPIFETLYNLCNDTTGRTYPMDVLAIEDITDQEVKKPLLLEYKKEEVKEEAPRFDPEVVLASSVGIGAAIFLLALL